MMTRNSVEDFFYRLIPAALFALVGYLYVHDSNQRDIEHERFLAQLDSLAQKVEAIDTRQDEEAIKLAVLQAQVGADEGP